MSKGPGNPSLFDGSPASQACYDAAFDAWAAAKAHIHSAWIGSGEDRNRIER